MGKSNPLRLPAFEFDLYRDTLEPGSAGNQLFHKAVADGSMVNWGEDKIDSLFHPDQGENNSKNRIKIAFFLLSQESAVFEYDLTLAQHSGSEFFEIAESYTYQIAIALQKDSGKSS